MKILDRAVIAVIKLKVTLHIMQGWLAYTCNKQGCQSYEKHSVIICLHIIMLLIKKKAEIVVIGGIWCTDSNSAAK